VDDAVLGRLLAELNAGTQETPLHKRESRSLSKVDGSGSTVARPQRHHWLDSISPLPRLPF